MNQTDDMKLKLADNSTSLPVDVSLCSIREMPLKYIVLSHIGSNTDYIERGNIVIPITVPCEQEISWNVYITENGKVIGNYPDVNLVTNMCGKGNWKSDGIQASEVNLNQYTLNVMLAGNGFEKEFADPQIDALINFLEQTRAKFGPLEILPLSDIDPRHCAPGKLFPWEKLAEKGLVKYPIINEPTLEVDIVLGEGHSGVTNIQRALQSLGYYFKNGITDVIDNETKAIMSSFNIHYSKGKTTVYDFNSQTVISGGFSEHDIAVLDQLTEHAYSPLWTDNTDVGLLGNDTI